MAGKFVLKTAKNGKVHFNLKASNGQILLSSEMYETRKAAEGGIASVKKNSTDPKRYDRKASKNGEHYFNLKATNGEPIGKSEMYSTAAGMERGIASVTKNAPGATIADA